MIRWRRPISTSRQDISPVDHRRTGVPNVVTSVLASYRGYDTLGEVVVIFTAGIGVWSFLGLPRPGPRVRPRTDPERRG